MRAFDILFPDRNLKKNATESDCIKTAVAEIFNVSKPNEAIHIAEVVVAGADELQLKQYTDYMIARKVATPRQHRQDTLEYQQSFAMSIEGTQETPLINVEKQLSAANTKRMVLQSRERTPILQRSHNTSRGDDESEGHDSRQKLKPIKIDTVTASQTEFAASFDQVAN